MRRSTAQRLVRALDLKATPADYDARTAARSRIFDAPGFHRGAELTTAGVRALKRWERRRTRARILEVITRTNGATE